MTRKRGEPGYRAVFSSLGPSHIIMTIKGIGVTRSATNKVLILNTKKRIMNKR